MKFRVVIVALLLGFLSIAQAQTRDVLYLKNGSVIKGAITEMNPVTGIKIKTSDGSIFVYKMDEILKSEKEEFVGQQINQETSTDVNQQVIDTYFINYLKEKRPALRFIGVSKINGVNREIFGQKIREIEYELIFEAGQDLYISDIMSINGNGFKSDFSYLTQKPQGWDAYINAGSKKISEGQRIVASGTISFEDTDNGWRANGFDNKNYKTVSSDYLSPDMAKRIAIEKAETIKAIKKDLEWRNADSEPANFDYKYYSLQDVPFFSFGNSRYLIKPSGGYNGRNDVASNIQIAFYEALNSTNRKTNSTSGIYSESSNQANYLFVISSVNFNFKDTGYQCEINVNGRITGTYKQPNTYPFEYKLTLNSKSNSYKNNMSKAQAFNEAISDFKRAVRGMIYKYNSIRLKVLRIDTNKRGKVDKIIFQKPEQFISIRKMDFILLKPENLNVVDGAFKMNGKIGNCTFKGDIIVDELNCDVSGGKNKKAIEVYLNSEEQLIGISSF